MRGWGLAALCLAALSAPAWAHFDGKFQPCDNRPPAAAQQPVSVPVSIFVVPGAEMHTRCRKQPNGLVIYGCTFLPSPGHDAVVLINGDQDAAERACTLTYEMAHLPPNNWLDAAMEAATPDAVPETGAAASGSGRQSFRPAD